MDLGVFSARPAKVALAAVITISILFFVSQQAHAAGTIYMGGGDAYAEGEATGPDGGTVTYNVFTAFDDDGPVPVTCTPDFDDIVPIGNFTIVCTATNLDGSSTATIPAAIVDTTPPSFTSSGQLANVEGDQLGGASPTWSLPEATDIADTDVYVYCDNSPGSYFFVGTTYFNCTARDDSGNFVTESFYVTVEDNTPPQFGSYDNLGTFEATSSMGAVLFFNDPGAYDVVDDEVMVNCYPSSSSWFPLGTTQIACFAQDSNGNGSYAYFDATVEDTTPPTFSNVPNLGNVEATSPLGAEVDFDPQAEDLVSGSAVVNCDAQSGTTFALGSHTVNCNATDDAGNPASTSFAFTVVDNTAPTFNGVPTSPVVVEATDNYGAQVDFDFLSATDAVDQNVEIYCSPSSGSQFPIGTTSVNCTARDDYSNTAAAQFDVTVTEPVTVEPMVAAGNSHTCTLSKTGEVACFGWNRDGQLGSSATVGVDSTTPVTVPLGGPAQSIAAGGLHTCAVLVSGVLKCWGANGDGQLGRSDGYGTSGAHPDAEPVDLGGESAVSVVAGANFTCVLLDTGEVKCFGSNGYGQVGDGAPLTGTIFDGIITPSPVDLGGDSATQISAGSQHACVRLTSGDVACWGAGSQGQLIGISGSPAGIHPEAVITDFDGEAVAVAAGNTHTCVLLTSGEVKCAGSNSLGARGTTQTAAPGELTVAEVGGPVAKLSAERHTCFVLTDGSVRCAGWNRTGQLGNPTNVGTDNANPTPLPASFSGPVFQISAGAQHTCAVLTDGTVECTGRNSVGQLGRVTAGENNPDAGATGQFLGDPVGPVFSNVPDDFSLEATGPSGALVNYSFPTATDAVDGDVPFSCSPATGVAYGVGESTVTCTATDAAGNESSVSFKVTVTDNTAPTISGTPSNFDALATGPTGGIVNYSTPTASDLVDGAVAVSCTPASGTHFDLGTTSVTCGAQDSRGNASSTSFNVTVFEPINTTPQITAGAHHTCTLSAVGQVACFGLAVSGQLGPAPGVGYSTATPTPVPLGGPAVAVAAGQQHTCVLMASGDVKCFGWNIHGELGSPINSGVNVANRDPLPVDLDGNSAVSIAAGDHSTCAVLSSGALKCWGRNQYGQLGSATNVGTGTPNPTPTTVDLGGESVSAVSVGATHTCALLASGDVSCWGGNDYGGLIRATGLGTTTPIPTPETVDFDGEAVEVDTGNGHTCVRLTSGEVKCSGTNSLGQLANASAPGGFQPVSAELAGAAVQVGLGAFHSCFVLTDASVKCGGTNSHGQLASTSSLGSTTAGQPAQPADFGGPVFQVAGGFWHTCALLTDGTVRCVGDNARGQLGSTTNYGADADNPVALSTGQFLGDPVGPVISGMPTNVSTEATSSAGAPVTYAEPTALDAVDGAVSVSCLPASGSTFAIGTATVTCSAQDAAGHVTSSTFDVTVEDTTGPTISGVPSDITEEATSPAGAVVNFTLPTALDAVDGPATVTCSPASGSTFAIDTTEVTCEAEDSRGNPSSETFEVTVEDTTDPVFDSYPTSQTRDATGPTSALGYTMPTATDVADDDVEVVCSPEPTATYVIPDNAGINETVNCTATDDSGNEATLTFSVFLADYSAPVLSDLPADVELEATGASGAVVTFTPPTASDLVDGDLTASCIPASGSTFALGDTLVTCEATDFSNNTADHEFTVTVVDTTPPDFNSMLDDIVVEATGPGGAPVDITVAGATDLVDGPVPVICTPGDGQFPIGNTTVTCSTTDTRGNDDSYQFDVIVRDTTAPVISGVPADVSVPATSAAGAAVTYALPTASDLVDGSVPVGCSPAPGSTFAVGTTVVTCSASDSAAQSSTATFNVTVTAQVIDLATTFRIVSARKRGKRTLAVTVDVPAAGKLDVIATERRLKSSAGTSRRLKPGPGRAAYGRAVLDLEKSGRATALLRLSPRTLRLIKQRRKPLLRVTAKFTLPTGEVKHRVVFIRL